MKKILRLMPALNLLVAAVALCFLLFELLFAGSSFGVVVVLFGPLALYGLISAAALRLFKRERLPLLAEMAFICLSLLCAGLALPTRHYFLLGHAIVNLLVIIYSHLPDGGPIDL